MIRIFACRLTTCVYILVACLIGQVSSSVLGQSNRDWNTVTDDPDYPNRQVRTKTLTLHPAAETRPALKYRLIPSEFHQIEGNAAVLYLRAIGFPERNNSRIELERIQQEAMREAREKGISHGEIPPFSWEGMQPSELPVEEVKKYLQLTDFQADEIAAAHPVKNLDFSRNLKGVESLISILLPEVQQMRGLARTQSLRCRVAIAEGRVEDAIQIIGQQFRMANHLSQEPIVVTNLVGIAIFGIGWEDALDLLQLPETPNLFWAIASLPKPLVPLRESFAFEREWFTRELSELADVDETLRPAGFWQTFIDRILPQYNRILEYQPGVQLDRFDLVNLIAAGYPGAKRYLIEQEKMDVALVESYPIAQVFFLAQKKFADYSLDEVLKWTHLEFYPRHQLEEYRNLDQQFNHEVAQLGWAGVPVQALSGAGSQMEYAAARSELMIAMLLAVEGIRQYAAENDGRLPAKLSDLAYPIFADPFTGKPLDYRVAGDVATLAGDANSVVYRLKLQIAKPTP